ncbi:MAG: reverse transcriptase/maturase family protein [Candidatus Komeilibacteria bacterium]
MKKQLLISYEDIISLDNLLSAWEEFIVGKKSKLDVQKFSFDLMNNILALHKDLVNNKYSHGGYYAFYITDPKLRHIHKASVRDRLLHHAIYRQLYPFFAKTFIADSYSCQLNKGTHRAINRFREFSYKVTRNNTRTGWVLQCDIKRFFDSIDHEILIDILNEYILDKRIMYLLINIITSFESSVGKGLPLGNLTSQLFVNIYMNRFDQFIKHKLKIKYYIRYADDFIFFSQDKQWLLNMVKDIKGFLFNELKLTIHPQKFFLQTINSGVDFLGWVHFPDHRVLRNKTKRRMIRKAKNNAKPESLASYLGLLQHGSCYKIKQKLFDNYWINFLR